VTIVVEHHVERPLSVIFDMREFFGRLRRLPRDIDHIVVRRVFKLTSRTTFQSEPHTFALATRRPEKQQTEEHDRASVIK
jgi:hypothetical protein